MGTNYYAVRTRPTIDEPLHIGKSSIGWMFLFQRINKPYNEPPVVWNTFEQIKEWLKKYTESGEFVIINEYDEIIPLDDFIEIVEIKQKRDKNNPANFGYNVVDVDGYRFSDDEFC